ncbi:unnamed protein product [Staurois parvus]|uniref:Uncharacterized protein n=1 Tax=Staurois parvus TaxID=386267 RepID=A0ABN9GHF7_9NEOB|nr:unnamed protein product [Staurois parvus]
MIPYCPGGPMSCQSAPDHCTNDTGQEGVNIWGNHRVHCVLFYYVCCVCFTM